MNTELQRRGHLLTDGNHHVSTSGVRHFHVTQRSVNPYVHTIAISYDHGPTVEVAVWQNVVGTWTQALAAAMEDRHD